MVYSYLLNTENEIVSLCNYDNGKWQTLRINEELDENGKPLTNDLPPELGDKIIDGKIVKKVFNEEEEQKKAQMYMIEAEIDHYKKLLSSTDYQAIKYAEGELTEEEYSQMKNQRKQWRLEINNLEIELNQIKKSS